MCADLAHVNMMVGVLALNTAINANAMEIIED